MKKKNVNNFQIGKIQLITYKSVAYKKKCVLLVLVFFTHMVTSLNRMLWSFHNSNLLSLTVAI